VRGARSEKRRLLRDLAELINRKKGWDLKKEAKTKWAVDSEIRQEENRKRTRGRTDFDGEGEQKKGKEAEHRHAIKEKNLVRMQGIGTKKFLS